MKKSEKSALLDSAVQFIKSLLITIFAFFSWLVLTVAFISVLNLVNTEHYQPDDVPSERFDVLSIDEHEEQRHKKWGAVTKII